MGVRSEEPFESLLYRHFFFQWLFFDMTLASGPIERRAAWLHNQNQREWLPAYMRRWTVLSTMGFAFGAISERAFAAPLSCCLLVYGRLHLRFRAGHRCRGVDISRTKPAPMNYVVFGES